MLAESSRRTIRAAFVKAEGGVELKQVDRPSLETGSVMVRMIASGVCGTDLEKLNGQGITSSVLGHEVSGVITESEAVEFHVGDRVIPHHHVSCGECELCRAGAETMCERFRTSNFVPGGFADEFLVSAYNVSRGGVHAFANNLSFEEASFAEPLGCCIRGLARTQALSNKLRRILVVGAGPIGLLHMELIRSVSPVTEISAVDIIASRLDFAEKHEEAKPINLSESQDGSFSAKALDLTGGAGYDLVIVATGSSKAFAESLKCVRRSGNVLLFGAPHKDASHNLDLSQFFLHEFIISSSYSTTERELAQAIDYLETKKIDVKKFITSKFPLERIEEAMSSARSENQVKVLVTA